MRVSSLKTRRIRMKKILGCLSILIPFMVLLSFTMFGKIETGFQIVGTAVILVFFRLPAKSWKGFWAPIVGALLLEVLYPTYGVFTLYKRYIVLYRIVWGLSPFVSMLVDTISLGSHTLKTFFSQLWEKIKDLRKTP